MTPLQKTFNIIVAHSRQMTEQSVLPNGTCAYRTTKGNSCFIGCTIPNPIYKKAMESFSIRTLMYVFPELLEYYNEQVMCGNNRVLEKLQLIHDNFFPQREEKLNEFAKKFELVMPEMVGND